MLPMNEAQGQAANYSKRDERAVRISRPLLDPTHGQRDWRVAHCAWASPPRPTSIKHEHPHLGTLTHVQPAAATLHSSLISAPHSTLNSRAAEHDSTRTHALPAYNGAPARPPLRRHHSMQYPQDFGQRACMYRSLTVHALESSDAHLAQIT